MCGYGITPIIKLCVGNGLVAENKRSFISKFFRRCCKQVCQGFVAQQIGTRFLTDVKGVYASDKKLVEKYVVEGAGTGGGGGGEYPLQDGFGWTNGVTLKLLDLYSPGE